MRRVAETLGEAFARAVAAKDNDAVRTLVHPEIDFRGMTPGRYWEASEPEGLLDALNFWFDDGDHIEALEAVDVDSFADRERVGYRLRVRNADGPHLVEQQAYLTERDGRIGWLRIMCSGYRPTP
jgi:hypothetical protein